MPRLWPIPKFSNALELEDDIVLVRLGKNGLDDVDEYAEESVDAFDAVCRNGLDRLGE